MIKNNRPMAINLSFKGKTIGFLPGETKKLSHFFTPMDEYILAKRFGLEFIPDTSTKEILGEKVANTKVEKNEEENKLKEISQPLEEKNEVEQEMLTTQVKNLKEQAVKVLNEEENKKVQREIVMEMQGKSFMENDNISIKEAMKQKASLVEGDIPVDIVEEDEILLEKPVIPVNEEIEEPVKKSTSKKKSTLKNKSTSKKK